MAFIFPCSDSGSSSGGGGNVGTNTLLSTYTSVVITSNISNVILYTGHPLTSNQEYVFNAQLGLSIANNTSNYPYLLIAGLKNNVTTSYYPYYGSNNPFTNNISGSWTGVANGSNLVVSLRFIGNSTPFPLTVNGTLSLIS